MGPPESERDVPFSGNWELFSLSHHVPKYVSFHQLATLGTCFSENKLRRTTPRGKHPDREFPRAVTVVLSSFLPVSSPGTHAHYHVSYKKVFGKRK